MNALTAPAFHARIWDILAPLNGQDFEVLTAPAPTATAVAQLEATLGFALPPAVAAFCQRNNGLCVSARDHVWPPAREFDVGPAWTFWRGVVLLGIDAPDLPDWASIATHHQQLSDHGVTGILPLMKVLGDGERLWGMDRAGTLVEITDGDAPQTRAGDLTDAYAEQIAELVQRTQDMAQRVSDQGKRAGRLPG